VLQRASQRTSGHKAGRRRRRARLVRCSFRGSTPAGQHAVRLPQILGHQVIQQRADVRRLPRQYNRLQPGGAPRSVEPRHQPLSSRLLVAWAWEGGGKGTGE
jgi:hypothetical protein